MAASLEETLILVWRQVMVEDAKVVALGDSSDDHTGTGGNHGGLCWLPGSRSARGAGGGLGCFCAAVFHRALWRTVLPSFRTESSGQSVRTGSNSRSCGGDCRCSLHIGAPLIDRRTHCIDRNHYLDGPDEHEEGSG